MGTKNHKLVGGKLLQINKQFRDLKRSQQEKINGWLFQEYRRLWMEDGREPQKKRDKIIDKVMEHIHEAEIWIPETEVRKYFSGQVSRYRKRIHRELQQKPQEENLLTEDVIMDAVNGKKDAVQKVVEHYSDYIDELCTIEEPQKDDTVKRHIDEDMRQAVTLKLIESLPDFKAELEGGNT